MQEDFNLKIKPKHFKIKSPNCGKDRTLLCQSEVNVICINSALPSVTYAYIDQYIDVWLCLILFAFEELFFSPFVQINHLSYHLCGIQVVSTLSTNIVTIYS